MIQPTDDEEGHGTASTPAASAAAIPELRARAEQALKARANPSLDDLSPEDARRLVHELRVHQIELELQNEELRRAQSELEASRERYFRLYDLAPVGYLTLSEAGLIEEANLAAAQLLERPRAELIGRLLSSFICREDHNILYRGRGALRSTRERQRRELRLARDGHEVTWILLETTLAPEAESTRPHWHSILIDITARKRVELALLEAQARLRLVTEIAGLTFCEWDPRGDRISDAADLTAPRPAVSGGAAARLAQWAERLHAEDRPRILAAIRGFVEDPKGADEMQYRIRDADSGYRWLLTRLEAILDTAGRVDRVLLVHQDVTRRKASEERAVQLAQHDPLTGLASRTVLDQVAGHMLAGARRAQRQLAVLFFDLDRFKAINDLHGHAVGDDVLRAVARRLRATFRAEDLICRLGGDEFVVVLAGIRDADEAARTAQKALAALAPPYEIAGRSLRCAASLGISLFPQDGDTLGQLMQRADLALYQAKSISPGHYQFVTETLNRQVEGAARMERRLRAAVAGHAFRLVYQPVLAVDSGRVIGVEALLRWPRPDGGAIAPATFLPIAESIHLSSEIGQWVLETSGRQQRAWQDAGLPRMPISVNLSTRQFYHPRFFPELAALCQQTQVDPALLALQLSEATLLEDRERARQVLSELKALGVQLMMDDFGLGCSSLCEIEDLPLDALVIDRRLFQRLDVTRGAPAIIETLIHLGHALSLEVIAVGVKSATDLRFLREHHCDQAQGFYLGAPMPGSELIDWHRQHQPGRDPNDCVPPSQPPCPSEEFPNP